MEECHYIKNKTTMKETPTFTFGAQNLPDKEYHQWLIEIKQRFQQSQIKTAIKVNTALLEFYWNLGSDIVKMQTEKAWGSGFINQLSLDLRETFPEATGFSLSNIKYIRQWYLFYYQELTKSHQLGGFLEIPLGIASYQLKEIIDNTIAEFEKNKLKTL